ncbi:2-phosphosulfolactate phosphatase family protein [Clostridium sp. MB40-C1]|uniref:2-phosphosulfolactate phosphatase family protein n=1 Tax=Clostridium sp. MB40-C1 TaxID=3070996 RepID=UPI0027DF085E|nr:2-phosphosulfolactate phosphatase family protein [Clostridium sp. MB40-C1]WMJ80569.1 2-phosphosulfolactate phosphatase family protein [Clostridium sp. MB40-C1]
MNIDIIISSGDIKEEKIQEKTVVIIDMLRATSVIITALNNGCKEVIPVIDIEEAREIVENQREKYVLGGERKALKIEGFDFSNSPLEYLDGSANGKTLVMTTTNGTKAINRSVSAKNMLIGAMINASSVAKKVVELGNDVVIINSGTNGQFSIDDFLCSGYIIECILKEIKADMSDIAITAHYMYNQNEDLVTFIKNAKHYKVLLELGLEEDLEYCCRKDIIDIVPEFINGKIII